MGLLQDANITFGYYDILGDDEVRGGVVPEPLSRDVSQLDSAHPKVRQGLKTYSNWPTYPQLYAKGDLLGGLDIVKVS